MCSTSYTSEQFVDILSRGIQTKSHYKMTCSCCHQTIHRGDAITQILGNQGALRPRGLKKDVRSYTPSRNKWVHLHCRPSHWYTYGWSPMFCAGFTRYSDSIESRRSAACMDPDWGENLWEIPHPVWKFAEERIEKGVVAKFQALWRGYTTRKERVAEKAAAQVEEEFYRENKHRIGSNTAILFNLGEKTEALYSCEITEIARFPKQSLHVLVRFHHDQEKRLYTWRRFQRLERECRRFMMEMGILLVEFEGKIPTHHRHRFHNRRHYL
mgnify:CR=1 FL=1